MITLGAPRLTQNAASSALRDPVLAYRMIHCPLCVHQAMEGAMLAMEGKNEEMRQYIEQFLPVRLYAPK